MMPSDVAFSVQFQEQICIPFPSGSQWLAVLIKYARMDFTGKKLDIAIKTVDFGYLDLHTKKYD